MKENLTRSNSVAGMSIGGGKKENFFFCLLEYFETENSVKNFVPFSTYELSISNWETRSTVLDSFVDGSLSSLLLPDFGLLSPLPLGGLRVTPLRLFAREQIRPLFLLLAVGFLRGYS